MRSANPFSPAFGAAPACFFGRKEYLELVERAMANPNDLHRVFFLVGTRGAGKTVLLHRMAEMARDKGWLAYEMHSSHAARELYDNLIENVRGRRTRVVVSPKVELPGGVSASVLEAAHERGDSASPLLAKTLIERCSALGKHGGIFIAIDEAQKLDREDAVEICVAVQSARVQGLPVMLVMTGLPETKEKIARYDGVTFMRRARRVVLGPLTKTETREAFAKSFAMVPEIEMPREHIESLAHFTQGHPYLMQLVGHYVYENINLLYGLSLESGVQSITPTEDELGVAKEQAYWTYREDVLRPILMPLSDGVRAYLEAIVSSMDATGVMASGGDIARVLGKASAGDVSYYRERVIELCLVKSGGTGKLRFLLPYIPRALRDEEPSLPQADPEDEWEMEV